MLTSVVVLQSKILKGEFLYSLDQRYSHVIKYSVSVLFKKKNIAYSNQYSIKSSAMMVEKVPF